MSAPNRANFVRSRSGVGPTDPNRPKTELDLLIEAAAAGNAAEIHRMLGFSEYKKVVNDCDEYEKYSPLMWAAKEGHHQVVEALSQYPEVELDKPGGWVRILI